LTACQMQHDLFAYADDDELARRITPFLRAGVADGSHAIMVLEPKKSELLGDALGSAAEKVEVIDCSSHYSRPEAALADYDATLRRLTREGVGSVRLFGELPLLDAEADYGPWIAYEAILNRAFSHHPVWITCGYDTRVVAEGVMEDIRRAHPRVLGAALQPAAEYVEPADLVRAHAPEAPSPPRLEHLEYEGDTLSFRRGLRRRMSELNVPQDDADAMLVAGGEVLVNAERHGGGARELRCGCVDGQFVLEVSDRGAGVADPLAGYLPPTTAGERGAGLWVARQLTRRLELLSDGGGMTVRLWI
jgi:anti-sigma regulatory factor (Ser/Thr protein kinase)